MDETPTKVGCCGFAAAQAVYFREFPVVEIQQTFYQPPRPETADRWREKSPGDFEFVVKAWQLVTHEPSSPTYRRLRAPLSAEEIRKAGAFRPTDVVFGAWERTRQIAQRLQATKVLFQCPASFRPTTENMERMRSFFRRIDRSGIVCIWEPRGAWQPDQIAALCQELDLVHCVDPFQSECVTSGLRYYRLHGVGGYDYQYSDQELNELLRRRAPRLASYFMFNNVQMWNDAGRFKKLLASP